MLSQAFDRRRFLQAVSATGLGAAVGCQSSPDGPATAIESSAAAGPSAGPAAGRALVVVELRGGNDGLSMLVPRGDPALTRLRPSTLIPDESLVDLGDGWALAKGLDPLRERGLVLAQGIGAAQPDLSHFEMMARWWAGSPNTSSAIGFEGSAAGSLGRICDRIRDDELLTGISMGFGPSAMLASDDARVMGIEGTDLSPLLSTQDDNGRRFRAALAGIGASAVDTRDGGPTRFDSARSGLADLLEVADAIAALPEAEGKFPEHSFGRQMELTARLLRSDVGVRVVHVPMDGGSFDTHENHVATHVELMDQLGTGLAALLGELDDAGLGNRVLVATTSEFGRRAGENSEGGGGGGLDHGTASTMLACGAVASGTRIVGDAPSLTELDDDSNLVATAEFDRWFATMATWLDVDPASVLAGGPAPLDGVLG